MRRGGRPLIFRTVARWPELARSAEQSRSRRTREREHRGIVSHAIEKQALLQDAFTNGAGFLGHAVAGDVAHGDDDLEADQARVLKSPVSNQANRPGSDAPPGGARSDPVAEISSLVGSIDPVET